MPERVLKGEFSHPQSVVDAACNVGKNAAHMRPYDVQFRVLVQRAGDDELGREVGIFERKAKRVVDIGSLCQGCCYP